ncbi:hypothetical protein NKI15_15965 [Mesorhizobium sp. M0862]|uniref:hypothetical protein n=1 Tax=Mesorhizobium sp. M0862 TaxID=2957015 RepID=UPI003337ECAA
MSAVCRRSKTPALLVAVFVALLVELLTKPLFQLCAEPCGSSKLNFSSIPSTEGNSHYLASNLPANTKYSVNRQFIPVRQISLFAPEAPTIQRFRQPRKQAEIMAKTHKIREK